MPLISDLFEKRRDAAPRYIQNDRDLKYFFAPNTKAGVPVDEDEALKIAAVYLAVKIIAETIGMLPVNCFKKGEGRRRDVAPDIQGHYLLHSKPNLFQTPMQFKEMMTGHCVLRGKAVARKIYNNGGQVVQLIPIHPDLCELKFKKQSLEPYFEIKHNYQEDGRNKTAIEILDMSEVFHMYGLSLGMRPISPIEAMAETIGVSIATRNYRSSFFSNAAMPSGIIKHPTYFKDDKDVELVREEFKKKFSGDNRFSPMVLQNGIEWHQIGLSNSDSELIKTETFQILEICRAFRMQPHKLMEYGNSAKANVEQASIEFHQDTMAPWAVRFEESLNRDFLTEKQIKEGYYFKCMMQGLLRGDTETRNKSYAYGRQWGWYSANDVLELEDRNPLPGDIGESYLVPVNMIDARAVNKDPVGDSASNNDNSLLNDPNDPKKRSSLESALAEISETVIIKILKRQEQNFKNNKAGAAPVEIWYSEFRKKEEEIAQRMLKEFLPPLFRSLGKTDSEVDSLIEGTLVDIFNLWPGKIDLRESQDLIDKLIRRVRDA